MTKEEWYGLKVGDYLISVKGRKKKRITHTQVTVGGSLLVTFGNGTIHATSSRQIFDKCNPKKK